MGHDEMMVDESCEVAHSRQLFRARCHAQRILLVAALFSWTAGGAAGCRSEPTTRQQPLVIKLAARVGAEVADVRQTPGDLDFSDPRSSDYLPSGWNPPRAITGPAGELRTIIRTEGPASIVEIPIAERLALKVTLTLSPLTVTDSPVQYVTFLWNDALVDRRQIEHDNDAIELDIAPEQQRLGLNTLTLLPHFWIDKMDAGLSETDLRPGFRVDGIRVDRAADAPQPKTPLVADGDDLVQEAGTAVSFYEFVPEAATLSGAVSIRSNAGAMAADAGVSLRLQQDGAPAKVLLEWPAAELQAPAARAFQFDLAPYAGRPIALTLIAPRATTSGGTGAKGPQVVWQGPQLRGSETTVVLGERPKPAKRPNIVMILFDALRADFTGPYGATSIRTPNMNELAQRGVTFVNATSNAPSTRPSVATLLTSLLPPVHEVNISDTALADSAPYLPAILGKAGYRTIGVSDNPHVSVKYGFSRGFDHFTELFDSVYHEKKRRGAPEELARDTWDSLVSPSLPDNGEQPFFLYIHEIDPHFPYDPPAGYSHVDDFGYRGALAAEPLLNGKGADIDFMNFVQVVNLEKLLNNRPAVVGPADIRYLRSRYGAEVSYMDSYLGWITRRLAEAKLTENTLVVFLSDHGEQFFEHGHWTHGPTVYQEDLSVPLILSFPGVLPTGQRPAVHAELLDVAPTLLELAGIAAPAQMRGRSLVPYATNAASFIDRKAALAYSDFRFVKTTDGATLVARLSEATVRFGDWKLIRKGRQSMDQDRPVATYSLYDLATDPAESVNLWASKPVLGNAMRQLFESEAASNAKLKLEAPVPQMDEGTSNRLKSLGYAQ